MSEAFITLRLHSDCVVELGSGIGKYIFNLISFFTDVNFVVICFLRCLLNCCFIIIWLSKLWIWLPVGCDYFRKFSKVDRLIAFLVWRNLWSIVAATNPVALHKVTWSWSCHWTALGRANYTSKRLCVKAKWAHQYSLSSVKEHVMTRKNIQTSKKTCAACNARQAEYSTKRSPESDFWIDCDNCHKWFHDKCYGLTKVECNRTCPFIPTTSEIGKHTTEPRRRKLLQNSSQVNLRQTPRRSLKAIGGFRGHFCKWSLF